MTPARSAASGTAQRAAETLLIGLAGGTLFNLLGLPAGLISGSVLAASVAALAGRKLGLPAGLARIIYVLAGIALGSSVTPATLHGIATYPISIAVLVAATLAVVAATALYLRVVHRWDLLSALFGASPGALAQVLVLSVESGADVPGIVVVQTFRVVTLTVCLPSGLALMGLAATATRPVAAVAPASPAALALLVLLSLVPAVVMHRLRFPGGLLFGAMLGAGTLHGGGFITGGMPWWVADAVMIALGSVNGSRFAGTDRRVLIGHVGAAIGSFAVAVAVTVVFLLIAAHALEAPMANTIIAYAPGAQDTMMLLALALHLDPVFVGAHHLARFLTVSLTVPFAARALKPQSAARSR